MEKNKGLDFDTFTSGDGPTIPDNDLENYSEMDNDAPHSPDQAHGAVPEVPQKSR
jgi:hypothetical protein